MKIKELMTIIVMSSAIALAACNTVKGAGEDVQSAANATENAIN
ncbi:VENN motif pre-toxin domain-containing protein [Sphingosinicella rhizophila]|uniref:VENN motif pre-toxin domain-containing protein n=1 Tax=Sphingosinicella rhizophila TaxID=3050082 RepID=A0ABU3QB04_9SPHN|nr:VENN motif pre-toxin domain-containing protein [Sphingosinicella sp. GR2756]MDT9600588.1 VENN motif pre-toxin domain-containing protein [Sphingosinicella sp. GR2756]